MPARQRTRSKSPAARPASDGSSKPPASDGGSKPPASKAPPPPLSPLEKFTQYYFAVVMGASVIAIWIVALVCGSTR